MRQRFLTVPAAFFALSCILHTTPAKAESFLFTASAPYTAAGPAVIATATLTGTADLTTPGAFDLTGGSGTWSGTAITLYTGTGSPTATSPVTENFTSPPFTFASTYEYDNVLFTSGNNGLALDQYGLLFSAADNHYNPFIQGNNYVYTDDTTVYGFNAPLFTVTVTDLGPSPSTVTPEPSSIALLGTGLLGVAGVLRRRVA